MGCESGDVTSKHESSLRHLRQYEQLQDVVSRWADVTTELLLATEFFAVLLYLKSRDTTVKLKGKC